MIKRKPSLARTLPLVSQYLDMPLASWKARSCGIAALATVVEFYTGVKISLRSHFKNARAVGAYMLGVGWKHKELAALGAQFGLSGKNFDWANETGARAWKNLKLALKRGPIIASIHKDFMKTNDGHLIVVSAIKNDLVFYNEPASKTRKGIVSGFHRKIPRRMEEESN